MKDKMGIDAKIMDLVEVIGKGYEMDAISKYAIMSSESKIFDLDKGTIIGKGMKDIEVSIHDEDRIIDEGLEDTFGIVSR